jgi:stage V sporulation protein B
VLIRTVTQIGIEQGLAAEVAAKTAAGYAGLYKATQTFAFVPYQLILSVTFVVFPMVSQATSAGDSETTRRTIRGAMRFSLLVLLAIATPIAGAAGGVMLIAYPAEYVSGAAALSVLSIGLVCFALFVIAATVLSGAGRPGLAAAIAGVTVVIVIVGNIVLVRHVGLGDRTLIAAASATSLGTAFALVAVGTAVYLRFGAFIPVITIARALLAASVGFGSAHFMPSSSRVQGLAALIVGGVAYLLTLIATREIGTHELAAIRKVVGR